MRSKPSRHITGAALYSLEGWASLEQLLIAALNLTCCGSPPALLSCAPFLCPPDHPMPGAAPQGAEPRLPARGGARGHHTGEAHSLLFRFFLLSASLTLNFPASDGLGQSRELEYQGGPGERYSLPVAVGQSSPYVCLRIVVLWRRGAADGWRRIPSPHALKPAPPCASRLHMCRVKASS